MKKAIGLTLGLAISSVGFAQKPNVTSAAMEYQDFQGMFQGMMLGQQPSEDDQANAIKALLSAKEYITPTLTNAKTAEWNKTHRYNAMINLSLMMVAGMDSTNADLAPYREESFAEEVEASFKKLYEVDQDNRYIPEVEQELNLYKNLGVMMVKGGEAQENTMAQMAGYAMIAQMASYMQEFDSSSTYLAGAFAMEEGEYEMAEKAFLKCLENGFRPGLSAKAASEAMMKQGKNEEAAAFLEEQMKKYPGDTDLLFGLINYYLGSDNPAKAEEFLKMGLEAAPENKTLVFALGTVYDKQGNLEDAASTYQKALDLDPKYYDALYNLGAVRFNQGVAAKNEASMASDADYPKLMEKANTYFQQAIDVFLKAREQFPEEKDLVRSLRDSYRALGDKEKTAEYHELYKNM